MLTRALPTRFSPLKLRVLMLLEHDGTVKGTLAHNACVRKDALCYGG